MIGSLIMSFLIAMSSSGISDVKLFGIEDNVTLFIGSEIPIAAEVLPQPETHAIEWLLNQPQWLNIKENGNIATLYPVAEGAVEVMARLNDGSYSSRSIYVKTAPYTSTTSAFKIIKGMAPIKQYGINKKTFQVEVDSKLDAATKNRTLKQYLSEIQQYGDMTIQLTSTLQQGHQIYTLSITGYPNHQIEIRLNPNQSGFYELKSTLEQWPLINNFDEESQALDPIPPMLEEPPTEENNEVKTEVESTNTEHQENNHQENQTETSQKLESQESNIKADEIDKLIPVIKDSLISDKDVAGTGTKDSPFELTLNQLLSMTDVLALLELAQTKNQLTMSQPYRNIYRLRIHSITSGNANELYIEILVPKTQSDKNKQESSESLLDLDGKIELNSQTSVLAAQVEKREQTQALDETTPYQMKPMILMEMLQKKTQGNNPILNPKAITKTQYKKYYGILAAMFVSLLGYSIYLRKK